MTILQALPNTTRQAFVLRGLLEQRLKVCRNCWTSKFTTEFAQDNLLCLQCDPTDTPVPVLKIDNDRCLVCDHKVVFDRISKKDTRPTLCKSCQFLHVENSLQRIRRVNVSGFKASSYSKI